ncbi:hypothetical protein FRC12_023965 [Ceratobasidium sp. 428]|nr:hypothetical protein FRC12_023965 [Ceratobasidium sp. 428]
MVNVVEPLLKAALGTTSRGGVRAWQPPPWPAPQNLQGAAAPPTPRTLPDTRPLTKEVIVINSSPEPMPMDLDDGSLPDDKDAEAERGSAASEPLRKPKRKRLSTTRPGGRAKVTEKEWLAWCAREHIRMYFPKELLRLGFYIFDPDHPKRLEQASTPGSHPIFNHASDQVFHGSRNSAQAQAMFLKLRKVFQVGFEYENRFGLAFNLLPIEQQLDQIYHRLEELRANDIDVEGVNHWLIYELVEEGLYRMMADR